METIWASLILVVVSIIPPMLLAMWVRNREGLAREPLTNVAYAMAYGATIGATMAWLLNTLFSTADYTYGLSAGLADGFLTAVVAAPIIEEFTKGTGLGFLRRSMEEPEDGLVYGAAIGFGFSIAENLLYGFVALSDAGSTVAIQTVVLRSLSSSIMHGSATALLGFGYALALRRNDFAAAKVIPYYLVAVVLHAGFNVLVTIESWAGMAIAIAMAWATFAVVHRIIHRLDAMPHQRV